MCIEVLERRGRKNSELFLIKVLLEEFYGWNLGFFSRTFEGICRFPLKTKFLSEKRNFFHGCTHCERSEIPQVPFGGGFRWAPKELRYGFSPPRF
jgi:hypothetical protein